MIQLQRDRFILNWRKVRPTDVYPRYKQTVRPRFEREWLKFKEHLTEFGMGTPDIQQCEVTYVNDMVHGDGWDTVGDMPKLFSFLKAVEGHKFLPPLETINCSGSFLVPNEFWKTTLNLHLPRTADDTELLQFRLTARGRPESSSDLN